jgi:hypothetical protein
VALIPIAPPGAPIVAAALGALAAWRSSPSAAAPAGS